MSPIKGIHMANFAPVALAQQMSTNLDSLDQEIKTERRNKRLRALRMQHHYARGADIGNQFTDRRPSMNTANASPRSRMIMPLEASPVRYHLKQHSAGRGNEKSSARNVGPWAGIGG